jgi:DNA-binding response OmpR family regulator
MKILLIEDEIKIANAIKKGLEHEKYLVEVFHDGEEGLGAILDSEHDLVILDCMLPSLDGVEVCRKARAAKVKTPIIMLTARSQSEDKVGGLDAGADDYLVKPFSFEELLARLRALLRRPNNLTDNLMRVDDLVLDTATYEVSRDGKKVNLSRTEFNLLAYLMRNAGLVLTKDTIISHVWNFDADILPNTVEAYIGYLRAKIDKPFKSKPLIKTLRGFGYKLDGKLE